MQLSALLPGATLIADRRRSTSRHMKAHRKRKGQGAKPRDKLIARTFHQHFVDALSRDPIQCGVNPPMDAVPPAGKYCAFFDRRTARTALQTNLCVPVRCILIRDRREQFRKLSSRARPHRVRDDHTEIPRSLGGAAQETQLRPREPSLLQATETTI
ncbi:U11/U12 small nuclear ribonucleoprotein 25 kDa protein-like protein [Anopheles sinensis]|uniref:U11/U12 small nuclear ribonucleoprotein 25 kDa protein-like protein n=1 Tax=Anopheles sinensis TaxID=74873 RepID=A0A084WCU0_ANOSI|nr:U11/U12 small nuclear ribonucleoprotein 25 kDa protein-like protein [Anopheles sinensis]